MLGTNRLLTILVLTMLLLSACQPIHPVASVPASKLDNVTVAKIEGIVQKAMMDYPAPGIAMCTAWCKLGPECAVEWRHRYTVRFAIPDASPTNLRPAALSSAAACIG